MKCPNCNSTNLLIHTKAPQRWACGECSKTTRHPISDYDYPTQTVNRDKFVITWAQNATPVDARFLKSIRTYCAKNKAQLLVLTGRYRNATSRWSKQQETDEWWDEAITPDLLHHELQLNKNLTVMGGTHIQPTAVDPLSGMKTLSGPLSCIFGHPQIAHETVATPQSKMAKVIATTGSITRKNYSDTKAGKKGDFHHEVGAIVIELDEGGKVFHKREIIADGHGKFYDLDKLYDGDKVTGGHSLAGLVSGDFHGKFLDPQVQAAIWTNKDSICAKLKPQAQVFHDVLDGYFGSHWHESDPFLKLRKHLSGADDGRSELEDTLMKLNDCLLCDKNYITKSNHDEHLDRWLKETDWRKDPRNAKFYLDTALAWVTAITNKKPFDTLQYWAEQFGVADNLTFLKRKDVISIKGYVVSMHGDKGANGAKGSIKGFSGLGSKSIVAHSHSPGRNKGCIQVGLSAIYGLEYAVGSPSSWMQTCAIIYPNGKVSLINIVNGQWRK